MEFFNDYYRQSGREEFEHMGSQQSASDVNFNIYDDLASLTYLSVDF